MSIVEEIKKNGMAIKKLKFSEQHDYLCWLAVNSNPMSIQCMPNPAYTVRCQALKLADKLDDYDKQEIEETVEILPPPMSFGPINLFLYNKKYLVIPNLCFYQEGNVAITLSSWDAGYEEPFATLTVNLGKNELPSEYPYSAFVDVNNLEDSILSWVVDNGLGNAIPIRQQSRFVSYPLVDFLPL